MTPADELEQKKQDVEILLSEDAEPVDLTEPDPDSGRPDEGGWGLGSFAVLVLIVIALPIVYFQGSSFFSNKDPVYGFWLSAIAPFVAFSAATFVLTTVLMFQLGFKVVIALVKHFVLRKPSDFELDKFSKWPAVFAFFGTVTVVGVCFGALLALFSPDVTYFPVTIQMALFCVLTCTPVLALHSL